MASMGGLPAVGRGACGCCGPTNGGEPGGLEADVPWRGAGAYRGWTSKLDKTRPILYTGIQSLTPTS